MGPRNHEQVNKKINEQNKMNTDQADENKNRSLFIGSERLFFKKIFT